MSRQTQGSGSDPAARIFNRALSSCWKQTPIKSDPVHPKGGFRNNSSLQKSNLLVLSGIKKETPSESDPVCATNGFRHDDSQQKPVLGSDRFASLERSTVKLSEVSKNSEMCKLEGYSKSQYSDHDDVDISDNQSTSTKQKRKLSIDLFVSHSNIGSVVEHNSPNLSNNQPKRKMKSSISIINNHLSNDCDAGSTKPSLKRSSSHAPNSCFEYEHRWANNRSASNTFMSERRSDTALLRPEARDRLLQPESTDIRFQPESRDRLLQPESRDRLLQSGTSDRLLQQEHGEMSKARHSTPKYTPGNSNESTALKSNSFASYTPNSRFAYKRNFVRHHHRSLTYPNKNNRASSADVTPYSAFTRSSESSSMSRTKRMRTSSFIPQYDLRSINLKNSFGVIDSHCHLDFLFTREDFHESYSDYRSKHSETFHECYEGCITIFCEPQNFLRKAQWDPILQEEGVWAAFGCHPHMAHDFDDKAEEALIEAIKDPKVVALGEIGLDYSKRNNCDREVQKDVFRTQLKIAIFYNRPLVIHCREAHDDCIEIMKEMVPRKHSIHLHCFTDTWERADTWLKEFPNLYIGITNLVTFPSAEDVHELARNIPIDRLLLETDAPYFVPRLLTKRWSHPGMVVHVAAQIAAFRPEIPVQNLIGTVRNNTHKVYGI